MSSNSIGERFSIGFITLITVTMCLSFLWMVVPNHLWFFVLLIVIPALVVGVVVASVLLGTLILKMNKR